MGSTSTSRASAIQFRTDRVETLDYNILRSGTTIAQDIVDALHSDLPNSDYAGIVLTLTGYERAWDNNINRALEDFVEHVSDIAKQYHMPLLLPRSNWYGARLTDLGANSFSALFNGHERIKAKGGAMKKEDRHHLYGKTALYQHGVEISVDQLEQHLSNNGGQVT